MTENTNAPELVVARKKDLDLVLQLVREFHKSESLELSGSKLTNAVYPLLKKQNEFGNIYLIQQKAEIIGYITLCFCYSVEFGGRDAFVDELYIKDKYRGKKFGKAVLELCKPLARELGIKALHLEVSAKKSKLQAMYESCGFKARSQYVLMTTPL